MPTRRLLTTALAAALAVAPALPAAAQDAPATQPRGELEGRVYLGRNRPVVGAAIEVRPAGDDSEVWLTATDTRGEFKLQDLHNRSYVVEVTRPGLTPVVKRDVAVRFPFRAVVEVLMSPRTGDATAEPAVLETAAPPAGEGEVAVEATVRERGAGLLGDVQVRLVHPEGEADPRAARSDETGRLRIAGLPAGAWRLEAWTVGFLPVRQRLMLGEDTGLHLVLVRQPPDYEPSPLELMPPEQPIPPPGLDLTGEPAVEEDAGGGRAEDQSGDPAPAAAEASSGERTAK